MRTVIILARKHGSKKFELVSGPEIPAAEALAAYKDCCRSNVHPEYAEVELWESSAARMRSRDLMHPKEAKAKAERDKKAAAEAEAKKKAAEKAEADKAKASTDAPKAPPSKPAAPPVEPTATPPDAPPAQPPAA